MQKILENNIRGVVGEYIKDHTNVGSEFSISSNIFTIYAFHELQNKLKDIDKMRFIFNQPTFIKQL